MASPLHRNDHFSSIEKTSIGEEVAPIGHPKSRYVEECITRFGNWQRGRDDFCQPGGGEGCLVMPLSTLDFMDFKKALNIDEDEKFPKYSYDASSSILAIERMPSPIHEKVVTTVADGFSSVRKGLPTNLRRKIHIVTNQAFTEFDGKYDGTEKTPDTAVQITNSEGIVNVKFVLEVGLLESYDMLVQDAHIWLEGNHNVTHVMIVKMEENPPYQGPVRHFTDDQFEKLEFPERKNINVKTFALDGVYGPASYMGFCWVGQISGFLEIWERDEVSNVAKITPAGRINLLDLLNTECAPFSLHDFMEVSVKDDHKVSIDWDDYLSNLGLYIQELAAHRCRRMLKDRAARVDTRDADYEP